MSVPQILLLGAAAWIALVLAGRWALMPILRRAPGDPITGLIWYGLQLYCFFVHRTRFEGFAELRRQTLPGPWPGGGAGLIVVANHTSAVDPLLIQCGCRFHIRWLMAADMMIPELDWLWKLQRIIPVMREDGSRDTAPIREAIRHVRRGGVIGIFPEGRIIQRGEVRPFFRGVGVLAARAGAPVLLVWVSGTPDTHTMSQAFITPSRSRVAFVDLIDFAAMGERDPEDITEHLRRRLAEASGWRLNDDPMPPLNGDQVEPPSPATLAQQTAAAGT
jgi:1-acyl-sn-glycerol-3-phosphate acyltransferase